MPSVLFIASEATPYAKTGGLADAVSALAKALRELGCDVRLVIPYYASVRAGSFPLSGACENLSVDFRDHSLICGAMTTVHPAGFPVYFIQYDDYFDRPHLYGTPEGDYPDNGVRFLFFARSVFSLCRALGFRPGILHAHDWPAALVPVYLRHMDGTDPFFRETAGVLTIHNLAHQGIFPFSLFDMTGLPFSLNQAQGMEFWGNINYLKGGINAADCISTVSPTYSREILGGEFGCGLEGVLTERKEDLFGILNGVDYDDWNPLKDSHLPANYDASDLRGKKRCKAALLEEIGPGSVSEDTPLLGMVSRLSEQKGIDILAPMLESLLAEDVVFVILGAGDERYQNWISWLAGRFPDKMIARIGFDEGLAHRIEAGCDLFLMPSRYEPCGLNQFYSMRYGTVPVVRDTGGLADSVEEFEPGTGEGTGFKFVNYSSEDLRAAVDRALAAYRSPEAWVRLQRNCMAEDFSWEKSARAYLDLYRAALERRRDLQPGVDP